jgi:hypothetical protein
MLIGDRGVRLSLTQMWDMNELCKVEMCDEKPNIGRL